jgi:acyl-CoA synthetase (AMP-forming)/AMP-acid ligase II
MSVTEKIIAGRRLRWDQSRADDAYAKGLWVRDTLTDVLRKAAKETPDRVLIVDGAHRVDCRMLLKQATALAQSMLARAPAGSVVSFMLPNWHEAAVIYMAGTMAGMVINPILPSLRDRELSFILKDADVRLIFVPSTFRNHDYAAMLTRVVAPLETPPHVVVLRGEAGAHLAYDTLVQTGGTAQEFPALEPDAIRMVMFTSGTTGRPKGVLHTHNSIHALIRQLGEHWLIASGDKFLVPSPISHIGGSIYAFECPLLLGTTAVLMERWDAKEAVALIDATRCTHMAGATPFLEQILAAAREAGTHLASLKVFICGGASVPPSLIRNGAAYFERAVVSRVYGSTEVPVTTVGTMARDDVDHAAETDGQPGFAEIKLSDDAGHPVSEGQICARGPQMLVGYLHKEDEAAAFDDEGFYRTGDVGRWVDGRYIAVTGRLKDIIIRNGENISPKEIEDILIGHAAIAEIAVVGVPDSRTGERVCAVIVPKSGAAGPDVADLKAFLIAAGAASFKIPEMVLHWEALPKNDAGKVLKVQIRATIAARKSEV